MPKIRRREPEFEPISAEQLTRDYLPKGVSNFTNDPQSGGYQGYGIKRTYGYSPMWEGDWVVLYSDGVLVNFSDKHFHEKFEVID